MAEGQETPLSTKEVAKLTELKEKHQKGELTEHPKDQKKHYPVKKHSKRQIQRLKQQESTGYPKRKTPTANTVEAFLNRDKNVDETLKQFDNLRLQIIERVLSDPNSVKTSESEYRLNQLLPASQIISEIVLTEGKVFLTYHDEGPWKGKVQIIFQDYSEGDRKNQIPYRLSISPRGSLPNVLIGGKFVSPESKMAYYELSETDTQILPDEVNTLAKTKEILKPYLNQSKSIK